MKASLSIALLVLCGAPLLAQESASAPASAQTRTYKNDVGFSYTFPADWQVVSMTSTLPAAQQQAQQRASSNQERRGIGCTQLGLNARYGDPTSTVATVVLPFACLGSEMANKDLPGIGAGAVGEIGQNLNLGQPVYGSYSLGSHSMWIERVTGFVKNNPNPAALYVVETVCGILKKGVVCWMAIAADETALDIFEHGTVVLDGEAPAALVPANAFDRAPAKSIP